jgi:hypothetical protein
LQTTWIFIVGWQAAAGFDIGQAIDLYPNAFYAVNPIVKKGLSVLS